MTDKRIFQVRRDNPRASTAALSAIREIEQRTVAGVDFDVEVREPRRTLDLNACMWATLTDIAQQVDWPHTERGQWVIGRMGKDSWKSVLTAAFEQETQQAQGINGNTVMLGARTSQYSRRKMGEFLEFVHAFGSERGVRWSARAQDELAEFVLARRRVA